MSDVLPSGTDIQIAVDSSFSTVVADLAESYCSSKYFAMETLPYGADLYARVRHKHPETGTGNWSSTITFRLVVPSGIIGVCFNNNGASSSFSRIDALGNNVTNFNHLEHEMYTGVTQVTVDASRDPVTLTKFPLFYIKTAVSGPVGTYAAGKKCWWISRTWFPGARPAAAFKRSTEKDANGKYIIAPFCYIGTVLAKTVLINNVTTMGSQGGSTVAVGNPPKTCRAWISNRNNEAAGIAGFRMFDIWDLALMRILLVIQKCTADMQSAFLTNTSLSPKAGTTSSYAFFNNTSVGYVNDLWACYWCITALYYAVNKVVNLISPMDGTTPISFGDAEVSRHTLPNSGWLWDVMDCPFTLGDDTHDLMELFLPKTVGGTSSSAFADFAAVFDKNVWLEDYICTLGSSYDRPYSWTNSYAGLFCQGVYEYSNITSDIATRIAKS